LNTSAVSSKLAFTSSTIAYTVFLFVLGHVGLVNLYKLGRTATIAAAVITTIAIVALFAWHGSHRFFPLAAGLLLWAVMGEMGEHLGISDIVHIRNVFLIPSSVAFVFYLEYKRLMPEFLSIAVVFFLAIWASHFVLISFFEQLGRNHTATYLSSVLFVAIFVYSIFKILRENGQHTLTLFCILATCSFWSILEYLWAWKVLPKLW
jgi:hypothetical protein